MVNEDIYETINSNLMDTIIGVTKNNLIVQNNQTQSQSSTLSKIAKNRVSWKFFDNDDESNESITHNQRLEDLTSTTLATKHDEIHPNYSDCLRSCTFDDGDIFLSSNQNLLIPSSSSLLSLSLSEEHNNINQLFSSTIIMSSSASSPPPLTSVSSNSINHQIHQQSININTKSNSNNNNNNIIANTNNNTSNSNHNTLTRLGGNCNSLNRTSITLSTAATEEDNLLKTRTLFHENYQQQNNKRQGIEHATGSLPHSCSTSNNNNHSNISSIRNTKTLPKITATPREGKFSKNNNQKGCIANSNNINNNNNKSGYNSNRSANKIGNSMTGVTGFHLSLHGWRKKCLYILILLLMLLIIVNLILTLWILKVMEFSSEGMGQLKIVPGGIQLSGQALIMDLLRVSAIRSRYGHPISIESPRNFSIYIRDQSGALDNHFFLGHDKVECAATQFRIDTIEKDTNERKNLFLVNQNEVSIGAHALKIDGEGGAIFRGSVQTSHVRAEAGRELRLESPTRTLSVLSSKDVSIQSRAGSIELLALDDITLNSNKGGIRLDSSQIYLKNLKTAQPPSPGSSGSSHDHTHRVYQLCACANGKLFLAPPHSVCAGDDTTVCSS